MSYGFSDLDEKTPPENTVQSDHETPVLEAVTIRGVNSRICDDFGRARYRKRKHEGKYH